MLHKNNFSMIVIIIIIIIIIIILRSLCSLPSYLSPLKRKLYYNFIEMFCKNAIRVIFLVKVCCVRHMTSFLPNDFRNGQIRAIRMSSTLLVSRHLKPNPQLLWVNMSSNEIETNDVNGSRLAEQGPSSRRKKKDLMMIKLWLKNRNSFGETYGASLQTIRRMQSGYKTCEVNLMLKNRRR